MLEALCNMIAVSGYEKQLINFLYQKLETLDYGKIHIDSVGNLVFFIKGEDSKKKILARAHVDEVGFQIIAEISKGQYSLKSLGNIKTWNAHQQRVIFDNGLKGVIYAKDPLHMKPYNYDNLVLEINDSYALDKVSPGDVFTFDIPLQETEEFFIGKALDNRASCFCLWDIISKCKSLKNDTYFCFSVMEETNMRGARVLNTSIQPDICITIDASCVGDRNSLKLSNGVGIKISDSMGLSSPACVGRAIEIASNNGIIFQMEVSDCGTSELVISNEVDNGYEELGISIPCSHIHSANSIMHKDDIAECRRYLSYLISEI
ncbi:MAG: hypothetical protein IJQ86_01300 [Spirochaetia bacterium]|nr:hypothetical protein [Spirochaetia bacterium]